MPLYISAYYVAKGEQNQDYIDWYVIVFNVIDIL